MTTFPHLAKHPFTLLFTELAERARHATDPRRLMRAARPTVERARQRLQPALDRARGRITPADEPARPLIAPTTDTAVVERALREGRLAEALALTERLMDGAAHDEVVTVLRARALAAAGRDDAASKLIEAWSRRHGSTPGLLIAAADLAQRRGDVTEVERLCAAAVGAAPERADLLDRWLDLCRRRGGTVAWLEGLRAVATDERAWLPRVRLGAYCLGEGDHERAVRFYADAVATGTHGALTAALTDLPRAGLAKQAVALVAGRYDSDQHGPWAGLALLDACTACKDTVRGKQVLDALFMRHRHELRNHLQGCANRFMQLLASEARAQRLGQVEAPATVAGSAESEWRVVRLERPVWWYALRWPEWLLPEPAGDPLAVIAFVSDSDDEAREAALGATALIAEQVRLRCGQPALTLLPVRVGSGIETASPDDAAAVAATLAAGDAAGSTSLAGTLTRDAAGWRIEAVLRHGDGTVLGRWGHGAATSAAACAALLDQLAEVLGGARDELHRPLSAAQVGAALTSRAHLARLLLAQRDLAPRAGVVDDCTRIEAAIAEAQAQPEAEVPALVAIAVLAADHACGSTLHRESARAAAALAAGFQRGSTAWRASPLLFWLVGEHDAFMARREELLRHADGEFRAWLEAIGAEADSFVVIEE